MKTKLNFIPLFVTIVLFSGCSTYTYKSRVAEIQIENNINITPSVVDVKIDFTKKITSVSDRQPTPDIAREQAYYRAINENKIDVLVSPVYEIQSETTGNNSKATVTGFAGYFVNARTLNEEKKLAFDAKLEALNKMLKIDPIVKEEQKNIIFTGGSDSKGATTISTSSPSLVEKFMILYDDKPLLPAIKSTEQPTSTSKFGGLINKYLIK